MNRNVESGLQVLFLFCTLSATLVWMLAMNHNQLVSLFSDWLNCSHYSIYDKTGQDQFHKLVVLHSESCYYHTCNCCDHRTEEESRSSFCETSCLAMEVQKSFMKSIM